MSKPWRDASNARADERARNTTPWAVDMCSAAAAEPVCCLLAACGCAACVAFENRRRALRYDLTKYECCADYTPCTGCCGEDAAPETCLCLEASFCYNVSTFATRWRVQEAHRLGPEQLELPVLRAMRACQAAACLCDACESEACQKGGACWEQWAMHLLACCCLHAFLQAQLKAELDARAYKDDSCLAPEAMAAVKPPPSALPPPSPPSASVAAPAAAAMARPADAAAPQTHGLESVERATHVTSYATPTPSPRPSPPRPSPPSLPTTPAPPPPAPPAPAMGLPLRMASPRAGVPPSSI